MAVIVSMQLISSPKAAKTEILSDQTATQAEIQGLRFLQEKMRDSRGLLYYSVEHKAPASYSVLESIGQAMEYAALIGNKELFDDYAVLADKYFKDPSGYYYWKIEVAGCKKFYTMIKNH